MFPPAHLTAEVAAAQATSAKGVEDAQHALRCAGPVVSCSIKDLGAVCCLLCGTWEAPGLCL